MLVAQAFGQTTTTTTSSTNIICSLDIVHIIDESGSSTGQDFIQDALLDVVSNNSLLPIDDGAFYGVEAFSENARAVVFLGDITSNSAATANLSMLMFNSTGGTNLNEGLIFGYDVMMNEANGMRPENPSGNNCRYLTLLVNGGETIRPNRTGVLRAYRDYIAANSDHVDSINFQIIAYSDGVSIADGCNLIRLIGELNATLKAELADEDTCISYFEDEINGINLIDQFTFVSTREEAVDALTQDYSSCFCTTTTTTETSTTLTTSTQTSSSVTSSTTSSSTTTESTVTSTSSTTSTSLTSSTTSTSTLVQCSLDIVSIKHSLMNSISHISPLGSCV